MHYAPIPMVPGPVSLHPDVIDALNHDYGSGLIEPDYMALYEATTRNLAALMNTRSDVVLMTGEGMLALWGALKSCLKPGDGVRGDRRLWRRNRRHGALVRLPCRIGVSAI